MLRHGMTSLVGWSAVQMGQISWESWPHKRVDEFYSPRLTETEQGGYLNRGKFRSRISGFLTDKLSVLFAPLHTIHTNTHKHRKTRLSNACRKTHTLSSPPSLLFGLEAVQTTRFHAGKRVKRAFHSTSCCEWGLGPENSSGMKKQQEKWECTLPCRSQF